MKTTIWCILFGFLGLGLVYLLPERWVFRLFDLISVGGVLGMIIKLFNYIRGDIKGTLRRPELLSRESVALEKTLKRRTQFTVIRSAMIVVLFLIGWILYFFHREGCLVPYCLYAASFFFLMALPLGWDLFLLFFDYQQAKDTLDYRQPNEE